MVEDLAGCFIKTSKSSKLPVTRYFLLDSENECVRYFDNSIQLRRVLNKNLQWQEVMNMLDSPKLLNLKAFKLGPKALNSFSVFIDKQELTFFPWNREGVDSLYQRFHDIKELQKSNKLRISSGEADSSIERSETITLSNGNIYCGEINEDGVPHGNNGREFCEDGSIYYGSFRNGKWHGIGCIINSNLDMVQKEYINGEMCGF